MMQHDRKADADFSADKLFDGLADLLLIASQAAPGLAAQCADVKAQLLSATSQSYECIAKEGGIDRDRMRAMMRVAIMQAIKQIEGQEKIQQDAKAIEIWLERQQAWKRALRERNR